MFQKRTHLLLDLRDLIEAQVRICDHYRLTRDHMFVNKHVDIATLDRAEHFFALQHESQNVACVFTGRIVFSDETAQKPLGIVLRQGLWSGGGWRFVFRTPEGKRLDVVIPPFPGLLAKILAAKSIPLANQKRVKVVPLRKLVSRAGASVSA